MTFVHVLYSSQHKKVQLWADALEYVYKLSNYSHILHRRLLFPPFLWSRAQLQKQEASAAYILIDIM